jgi:drug/metabolite transporter (DMT)-like permease
MKARALFIAAMPGLFVLLWSTGFIGAKYGLPYAEPLTFLAIRFGLVAVLLAAAGLAMRAPWPRDLATIGHLALTGVLVHAVYLGGVFASIHQGVPAAVSALIVGLQPLLTAALAGPLLGERVRPIQWLGLILGLVGVGLVVETKIELGLGTPFAMGLSGIALLGITAGTLYQKRFGAGMDLRTGNAIQFVAATIATGLGALAFESLHVDWTPQFAFALGWLVVVLSLGAISLLMVLIREGAASRVASYFYLVPPVTALEAWLLFDERMGPLALGGMALVAVGVALATRGAPKETR